MWSTIISIYLFRYDIMGINEINWMLTIYQELDKVLWVQAEWGPVL